MKITFLIPPAVGVPPERIFGCNYGYFFQHNIFMLYPAAMLEKQGYDVEFIDCPVEGKDENWFKEFLKKDRSDAYVLYTVFLAEKTDNHISKLIRSIRKDVNIIFIGPEPTGFPERFLKFVNDDKIFVVRGETEITMKELIQAIEKKKDFGNILGLSWKRKGKIIHNPPRPLNENLDELPFPARHLIKKPKKYFNPKLKRKPSTVMLTSRNCWGRCIYCIPCSYSFAREIEYKKYNNWCKPKVGLRSPKNIAEEFKLIKKQGYKSVAIIDDNFVNGKERTIEICNRIKDLDIEWGCLARADCLQDEELLEAMAKAGCKYVDMGVESFDQKVLDYVHKDMTAGQILNAIILLKKHGIEPKINILFGIYPYETKQYIKWTLDILKQLDIDFVSFGLVIPHPYTEFYKIVKKNKWFATKSGDFEPVDPYQEGTIDFPNMDHKQLKEMIRWAYKDFYLRPSYIWKRLKNTKSFNELLGEIKTAWNLFIRKSA